MGAAQARFVAAQRPDGAPVTCTNGQQYGNVIMVAETLAGGTGVSGRYTAQGPGKVVLAGQDVRVQDISHVLNGAFETLNVPNAPFVTPRMHAARVARWSRSLVVNHQPPLRWLSVHGRRSFLAFVTPSTSGPTGSVRDRGLLSRADA